MDLSKRDSIVASRIQENINYKQSKEYLKILEYDAWYSSDINRINKFYLDNQDSGGLGSIGTLFYGKIKNTKKMVHIPIANKISREKSLLLFGEMPKFTSEKDEDYKVLLNLIENTNIGSKLLNSAEKCSAYGSIYIKPAWNKSVLDSVFPYVESPHNATGKFYEGYLEEVTFIRSYYDSEKKNNIYRLGETYTNDGKILYDLYLGDKDEVGKKVELTELAETSELKDKSTGIKRCLVVHFKNAFSQTSKGRSDYQGMSQLFEFLDLTVTSFKTEVKLSEAKVTVPEQFLPVDDNGNVIGNFDDNIFVRVLGDTMGENEIKMFQPDIRADKFKTTYTTILEQIVTMAGFSPQTFGLNIKGQSESGKSLAIREKATFDTKALSEREWKIPLQRLMENILLLQSKVFGDNVSEDVKVNVEFNDSISNDIATISDSLQKLKLAECASTETMVRIMHSDWTEKQVMDEVEKIEKDKKIDSILRYGNINTLKLVEKIKNGEKIDFEDIVIGENDDFKGDEVDVDEVAIVEDSTNRE